MASDPWNNSIKHSVDQQLKSIVNWKSVLYSKVDYHYQSNQVNCENLKELDLIIGYNSYLNMYIAWKGKQKRILLQ